MDLVLLSHTVVVFHEVCSDIISIYESLEADVILKRKKKYINWFTMKIVANIGFTKCLEYIIIIRLNYFTILHKNNFKLI